MPPVDPRIAAFTRELVGTVLKVGHRAISAGIGAALEAVGEVTEEADRRVKRGARAAKRMANTGETYAEARDDDFREEEE